VVGSEDHPQIQEYLGPDAVEENQYLSASLNNEINILRQIHCDNVVRFLDLKETANNYYIIQELCEGDLGKFMRIGGEMKESTCIDILTQLCTGFYELVRQNITHR
jgi:serine/threonine protein kinase